MRKYLPVVILLTAIFGMLSFYIAKEVIASINKKVDIESAIAEKSVEKTKDLWFKNFTDKDLEKNQIVLANIKAPFVLVNFWASWCGPCLKEFPELVQLRQKISQERLYIVGINCDDEMTKEKMTPLQKKYGINFPNILDPENKNLSAIGSSTLPVTLLYHKGILIFSNFSQTSFSDDKFLKLLDTI